MSISHNILSAINEVDFLKLQGLLTSKAFQKNSNSLKTLASDIVIKAEAKRARVNLAKYGVNTLEKGILKILKFIQLTFGRETLFLQDKIGKNFLDYAICRGYKQILSQFYQQNKVNVLTGDDYIMQAAKYNSACCIKWLCQNGQTLWNRNKLQQSALNLAQIHGAKEAQEVIRQQSQKYQKKLLLYKLYCGHHISSVNYIASMLNQNNLMQIFKYI